MPSKKTALLLTMLIGLCAFALICRASLSTPSLETCRVCDSSDPYGAKKDTFSPGENVYANGSSFPASTMVDIHVVNDTTWSGGMQIPTDGIVTTVLTDADGKIPPTLVWPAPLTPGKYDIVVDVHRDGYYQKDFDCLDDNDIQVTAGFFVIPEILLGTIFGLAGCFAALGVYRLSKRPHP